MSSFGLNLPDKKTNKSTTAIRHPQFSGEFIRVVTCLLACCAALLVAMSPAVSVADELPTPSNEIVLTIKGNIQNTNTDGAAEFDLDMLAAMSQATIETETPWTDGTLTFKGVTLGALFEAVGVNGTTVQARALNDYSIDFPIADADAHSMLMAVTVDGEFMKVRDKGPLWIVYPWSDNPALDSAEIRRRSVWQLRELIIQ